VLRIRDVYPGSRILIFTHPGSRIPDPKTATKERGEKKLYVKPFYVATKFNKISNYFSFDVLKKKIWANFQRIMELFTKKIVKKLFKIWSWDPGSGIRDPGSGKNPFRIPDPGVKKAPDPGSRIRIRNTELRLSIHLSNERFYDMFVCDRRPCESYRNLQ
jgi:hypothetical protein